LTLLKNKHKLNVSDNDYRIKSKGDRAMSLENKLDQATGAIKEEAEGTVEKTVAKAKEVVEDAKGAVEGAVEGLKNSFKKED